VSTRTWYVENSWTCRRCTTENLGRMIACSNCGDAKTASVKETRAPDAPPVVDPTLLALAQQGPHWSCEYCGGLQRDAKGVCANCGGHKPSQVRFRVQPKSAAPAAPARQAVDAPWRPILIVGAILALIFGTIAWLLHTSEVEARVTRTYFVHTSQYEERVTRHGEGWGAPYDAINAECTSRYYGDERCNPHQCRPHPVSYQCRPHSCNCRQVCTTSCTNAANGFSRCTERCNPSCSTCYDTCTRTDYDTCYDSCPVYKRWCGYDYYKWENRGERVLSGTSGELKAHIDNAWPVLGQDDATHRHKHSGSYIVDFIAADEHYSFAPDSAGDFLRFKVDQRWACQRSVLGVFRPVRPL